MVKLALSTTSHKAGGDPQTPVYRWNVLIFSTASSIGWREIVHRIDAPFVSCIVVSHMRHAVQDRISHIDISGMPCLSWHGVPFLHLCKPPFFIFSIIPGSLLQNVPVRTLLARLCQSSSIFSDLIRSQITDICFSLFNQLYRALIHHIKIIGCKVQMIAPVRAEATGYLP